MLPGLWGLFCFVFNQNMGLCTLLPSAGQTDQGNDLFLRVADYSALRAPPGQASLRGRNGWNEQVGQLSQGPGNLQGAKFRRSFDFGGLRPQSDLFKAHFHLQLTVEFDQVPSSQASVSLTVKMGL